MPRRPSLPTREARQLGAARAGVLAALFLTLFGLARGDVVTPVPESDRGDSDYERAGTLESQPVDPHLYKVYFSNLETTLGMARAELIDSHQLLELWLRGLVRSYGYKEYLRPTMDRLRVASRSTYLPISTIRSWIYRSRTTSLCRRK